MKVFEIATDGACSGNPGPAAIGVVITSEGKTVKTVSEAIGEATNNIAEYRALIRGLEEARALGAERIKVSTDSELMFRQIKGEYKVRHENMVPLHARALELLKAFRSVECRAVPREENKDADRLATSALKKNAGRDDRSHVFCMGEESPGSKG